MGHEAMKSFWQYLRRELVMNEKDFKTIFFTF